MQFSFWILILLSAAELLLFVLLLMFFARLRRSEHLLLTLQHGQSKMLTSLQQNAELERDLMISFAERQTELKSLDIRLEERAAALRSLLEQAEAISRSPQFLRELIQSGIRQGRTPSQLAKATNLSLDEVELILSESHKP